MAKNNRKCLCCNTEYYYCPTCRSQIGQFWRNNYCSENCREIFMIVTDCLAGVLKEEEAEQRLSKCDLSKKDNFDDDIKLVVDAFFFPPDEQEDINDEIYTEDDKIDDL